MIMINYPDVGFTPNNFQALVNASGLNNKMFIEVFGMDRASFYFYKNGDVTMQHKDWQILKDKVEGKIITGKKKEQATDQ